MDDAHHEGGEGHHRKHDEGGVGPIGIVPHAQHRADAGFRPGPGIGFGETSDDLQRIAPGLGRHVGVGAVEQELHRRRLAAQEVALEALRQDQRHPRTARLQPGGGLRGAVEPSRGAEGVGGEDGLQEATTGRRAVTVDDQQGHLPHVEGQGIGADHHFDRVEPEDQPQHDTVAQELDQFLDEEAGEPGLHHATFLRKRHTARKKTATV